MRVGKAKGSIEALPCNACRRQARFLTPYGLKCPEHALETAIYDDGPEEWMPIRIRAPQANQVSLDEDEIRLRG